MKEEKRFTEYFGLMTEGGRIALVSCLRCGAAVVLGDPSFDAAKRHVAWHEGLKTEEQSE
jgi:hypothetical protein